MRGSACPVFLLAQEDGTLRRRLEILRRSVHPVVPCSRVCMAAGGQGGRRVPLKKRGRRLSLRCMTSAGEGPVGTEAPLPKALLMVFPDSAARCRTGIGRWHESAFLWSARMGRLALRRGAWGGRQTARVCPVRVAFPATAWRPPRRAGLCRRVCAALPTPAPAGAVAGATARSVTG